MTDETEHRGYNVPEAGETDWHEPVNENWEAIDVDMQNALDGSGAEHDHSGDDLGESNPVNSIANLSYREKINEATVDGLHTIDASTANVHHLTVTDDLTLSATDSGAIPGLASSQTAVVEHDENGPYDISFGSSVVWSDGLAPDINAGAGEAAIVTFTSVDPADDIWMGMLAADSLALAGASDYLDGVIHQWKFDEGSGSTVADSEGTSNGTINGENITWVSGDYYGGYALDSPEHSESGHYIDVGGFSNLDWELGDSVTFLFSFETDNDDTDDEPRMFGSSPDDWDSRLEIGHGIRGAGMGQLAMNIRDDSGDDGTVATSSTGLNDGTFHRAAIVIDAPDTGDLSTSDITIYIDGEEDSIVTGSATWDGGFSDLQEWYMFKRFGEPSVPDTYYYKGLLDNVIKVDRAMTSNEVMHDYEQQPYFE